MSYDGEDDHYEGIWSDIRQERVRQDAMWGPIPERVRELSLSDWMTILTEEVGEAAEAAIEHQFADGPRAAVYREVVHVAAVCVSILQALLYTLEREERREQEVDERGRRLPETLGGDPDEAPRCVKHTDRPAVGYSVDDVPLCQSCAEDAIAEGEYDSISAGHIRRR